MHPQEPRSYYYLTGGTDFVDLFVNMSDKITLSSPKFFCCKGPCSTIPNISHSSRADPKEFGYMAALTSEGSNRRILPRQFELVYLDRILFREHCC